MSERNSGISKRIKQLIPSRQRSKFAEKCGIGESTLRGYESGRIPALDIAATIAEQAGVSLDWLATGKDEGQPSLPPAIPSKEAVLLDAYGKCSDRERDLIIALAEMLAEK